MTMTIDLDQQLVPGSREVVVLEHLLAGGQPGYLVHHNAIPEEFIEEVAAWLVSQRDGAQREPISSELAFQILDRKITERTPVCVLAQQAGVNVWDAYAHVARYLPGLLPLERNPLWTRPL